MDREEEEYKENSRKVKALMARLRMTQVAIARLHGISNSSCSCWLRGYELRQPHTVHAGQVLMYWYEAHKGTQDTGTQDMGTQDMGTKGKVRARGRVAAGDCSQGSGDNDRRALRSVLGDVHGAGEWRSG